MGGFVEFTCSYCDYREQDIGVGRGRRKSPYLVLFRCDKCKTIGSNWVENDQTTRCAACYHEEVTLLAAEATVVTCPKCEQPGILRKTEGSWE